MVYELQNEIRQHAGEQKQFDDITLLAVRRKENPLKEKHGICRVADGRSPGELMDFVEAAALESKLTPEEAISLRSATDKICKVLIQPGKNKNKPGMLSLFFEREDEKVSIILRDDGDPLGEELKVSLDAELKITNSSQDSKEPGINLDSLTYEVMEQGGNRISLNMTRKAGENDIF
jgi:anti-sigma regulatory factor (Ser/Thr protein kinase)